MRSAFTDAWDAPGAPEALAFPLQPLLTQEAMNRFEKFDVEEMVTYPAGQDIWCVEAGTVGASGGAGDDGRVSGFHREIE